MERGRLTFIELLAALTSYTDEQMGEPWSWPGHSGEGLEVRDGHWRMIEAEQAALVEAPAPAGVPAAVLDQAQAAWGDLRGLLAGLPAGALDREPGSGGWTIRQVLAHVLLIERRYRIQTSHAARRSESEPVVTAVPAGLDPDENDGTALDWVARLDAERALTDGELASLAPSALHRPTIWVGHPVDVEFRLHRFSAHMAEHAIQVEKIVREIGLGPTEAVQAARRLSALRGAHERRTAPETLLALTAAHARLLTNAP